MLQGQISVDGIVAAVENKIILKSDVVLNMELSGVRIASNDPGLEQIYSDFLNQMINSSVVLVAAEKDTNIIIDDGLVDSRLVEYVENIISEVGSKEKIEELFGKSFWEIKHYYREQIYNAMLQEMFVYRYVGDIDVSRKEVESFYHTYKDSLPTFPSEHTFSIIELPVSPGDLEVERVRKTQLSLLDSIKNGVSFSSIAKRFSQDPGTKSNGGDQGFYKKGTLYSSFEEAAFRLKIGEISEPIRTPLGFHLIYMVEKKQNHIHTKHILSLIQTTQNDFDDHKKHLSGVVSETRGDPGLFDSLAVVFKQTYNNNSGVYKNDTLDGFSENIKNIIKTSSSFSLVGPILGTKKDSYYLIYTYDTKKSYKPSPINSWIYLEQYAKKKKEGKLLDDLIKKLKHNTFIKYYD